MNQIYRPRDAKGLQITMEYVQKLIETVPMFEMGCTISQEAVEMAYNAMKEEN
jgi:hypothetical protein